jgi:hypothetical protein
MTTETKIKLCDRDMNRLFDMMGHAHRAKDGGEYQKLIPHLREAAHELAQRAFDAGRAFQRSNPTEDAG